MLRHKASTVRKDSSDCLKGNRLDVCFQNEVIVLKPLNDEKEERNQGLSVR